MVVLERPGQPHIGICGIHCEIYIRLKPIHYFGVGHIVPAVEESPFGIGYRSVYRFPVVGCKRSVKVGVIVIASCR
ncbi:hypothetical protein SDC9_149894 [bioreactor metagenome]|uniref:Uncharacterized protein n=1 Tax=bioreactor metagenome TaxID=1076179 RepID=A0A645EKY8_9ZZZZ